MFKRIASWWRQGETEIGRDGVIIRRYPLVTQTGAHYWNVRDIIFKPQQPIKHSERSQS